MRSRDPAVKLTNISIVSQRKHRGRKDSFADCLLISELSQDKQGGSEYHSLSEVNAFFFQLNKTGGSIHSNIRCEWEVFFIKTPECTSRQTKVNAFRKKARMHRPVDVN